MTDDFTIIERAIVEWLEKSGHVVLHEDSEWLLVGRITATRQMSITALACAIHHAMQEGK